MKFTNYQIDPTSKEVKADSKFWERGKWENYVVPHLPDDVSGMTYVDMGCNAGLFLQYAEEMGFERVVGVEINPEAIELGLVHRNNHSGNYKIIHGTMQEKINEIPVCDYISFINSHYYILIQDWMEMMAVLRKKARHVIITTVRRKEYYCMTSGYGRNVRRYFKDWEFKKHIPQLPREDDVRPRSLASYCFKNPDLARVPVEGLLKGNHVQGQYYKEIDNGVMPLSTRYFRIIRRSKRNLPYEDIVDCMYKKVAMYKDVKENGIKEPILVNKHYKILDGNHRKEILEYLGYKTTLVRKV
jgi:SAM-dependent methyltransferase